MRRRKTIHFSIVFLLLIIICYCNWKFELIAFNPFFGGKSDGLKVLTWNIHCPEGADDIRQKEIAELILKEDADFVLLNEYYQDSCKVVDSLLKARYPYTEEAYSHNRCGDIFYSKMPLNNSGRFYIRNLKRFNPIFGGEKYPDSLIGKSPLVLKATISWGNDSILIFGAHLKSNNKKDLTSPGNWNSFEEMKFSYERYNKVKEERQLQLHWLKEAIVESGLPVIVMGDMNDFSCSAPLQTLTTCGLKNAWWEGGNGYGATFHDGWVRLRIDHILHSDNLILQSIKVNDTNLSDHNPMVAEFSVNN